jgi:hypothetical protein
MVRPLDTGAVLVNPAMGWVLHYYNNNLAKYGGRLAPSDTLDDYPGLSVIYLRLHWSALEPEEGVINWAILDTPAQRWIAKGKQIALRISCSETGYNATPEWVREAGAKAYRFAPRQGIQPEGEHWEPDFDDPIFLAKLDAFLAALAARYDGSPEVAFIDVGSFGVWGEGHTSSSTKLPYSADTVKKHIALYRKHFRHTLLVANDDFADHGRGMASTDFAFEQGLTLRDDSILVFGGSDAYHNAEMAQRFWPRRPVILESGHYGPSRDKGYWGDGSKYLQALEEYHASYVSLHWWPREFLEENRELVQAMSMRLGYRLQLVEASWPERVAVNGRFDFTAAWRNAGVAPCYPGGHPAITLKDEKGGIVAVFADQRFEARSLPVGPPGEAPSVEQQATFSLPFSLTPGRYGVFISVGTETGTPRLALPLPDDDGEHRYRLGAVEVVAAGLQG